MEGGGREGSDHGNEIKGKGWIVHCNARDRRENINIYVYTIKKKGIQCLKMKRGEATGDLPLSNVSPISPQPPFGNP